MSDEVEPVKHNLVPLPIDRDEILRENVFGIVSSAEDVQTKIARMLALVPTALEVMDEARDTIQRLNEENEQLRKRLEDGHETDSETGIASGASDGAGIGAGGDYPVSIADEARAEAWAQYRKDYQPNPSHLNRESIAYRAGWEDHAEWLESRKVEAAPSDTDQPTERERVLEEVFINLADQGWDVSIADVGNGVKIFIQPVQVEPAPSDTDLPLVTIGFDAGTTFALTGENAGHWVEGSPTHVSIAVLSDEQLWDAYTQATYSFGFEAASDKATVLAGLRAVEAAVRADQIEKDAAILEPDMTKPSEYRRENYVRQQFASAIRAQLQKSTKGETNE